jgi:chromosome segregation ATPase
VNEKVITNISGEVRKLGSEIMDTLRNFHGTLKNLTLHLQSSHNMLKNELKNMEAFYSSMNNTQELFTSVQVFINHMKITYNEFHSCVETVNTFFGELTKQLQNLPKEFATVFEDVSTRFQEFASSSYDTENITQLLKEWYSSEQVLQDVMTNIAQRIKTLENKINLC